MKYEEYIMSRKEAASFLQGFDGMKYSFEIEEAEKGKGGEERVKVKVIPRKL